MTPTEAVVADSAAATDSRDLLERLMIAFKYISAELDPYIAQVLAPPPSPPHSSLSNVVVNGVLITLLKLDGSRCV